MLSAGFNLVNPLAVTVSDWRKRFFLFFLTLRTNVLLDVFRTGIGYDLLLTVAVPLGGKRLKLLVVACGTYALLGMYCTTVDVIGPLAVAVTLGGKGVSLNSSAFCAEALLRVHCAVIYNIRPRPVYVTRFQKVVFDIAAKRAYAFDLVDVAVIYLVRPLTVHMHADFRLRRGIGFGVGVGRLHARGRVLRFVAENSVNKIACGKPRR